MKAKLIAYYLPQYYPTPENDTWWGKGFTEWTNVTKAKPLYKGHRQPKFPTDLGYYDLRVPEAREAQAAMAKQHGLSGFCYYHYWFGNGRQVLNRPIDEVIASSEPDFPFCLCWANQSWTGHWFGADKKLLIKQEYFGDEDIEAHFRYLFKAFIDKRYIRIDDKPLLKILDINSLPDPIYYARKFKSLAIENGLKGLYLVAGNFFPKGWEPISNGFDATTDNSFASTFNNTMKNKAKFINRLFFNRYTKPLLGKGALFKKWNTITMKEFMDNYRFSVVSYPNFPIVLPNWDTTPRSLLQGKVIRDCNPLFFARQLELAGAYLKKNKTYPIIFIKSWNEWAEGNYLEPDSEYGHQYLEILKSFSSKESN